jgi:hypothetical protein
VVTRSVAPICVATPDNPRISILIGGLSGVTADIAATSTATGQLGRGVEVDLAGAGVSLDAVLGGVATVGVEVAEVDKLVQHAADGPAVTVDTVVLGDARDVERLALPVGRSPPDGLLGLRPRLGDIPLFLRGVKREDVLVKLCKRDTQQSLLSSIRRLYDILSLLKWHEMPKLWY